MAGASTGRVSQELDRLGAVAASEQRSALTAAGNVLKRHGLVERAVSACFDVTCVGHAPFRADHTEPPSPMPPAALVPWLFVGGVSCSVTAVRARLGDSLDELIELGLLYWEGGLVRPAVRLLPVGDALTALGTTAPGTGGRPDDSSFHLINCLPDRHVEAWLDVGTGNAIAPLAARGLATRVWATDIDPSALTLARIGAALSGADEIDLTERNLVDGAAGGAPWPLVTFNAPIPGPADDLLARFWRDVPQLVAGDSEVIVHSALGDLIDLPGRVVVGCYTPPEHDPPFGVTVWQPGARTERRTLQIELTRQHPHVRRQSLDFHS